MCTGRSSNTPVEVVAGMKWLRSNIRHGSRLALFALAIQFALSFGHFHGGAAQGAPASPSDPAQSASSTTYPVPAPDAVTQSAQQQPASDPNPDQQPNDPCACAICAVMALANSVLF